MLLMFKIGFLDLLYKTSLYPHNPSMLSDWQGFTPYNEMQFQALARKWT
jgi:hypothetical protein